MILVTGAAGKTGRAVTRALRARGETVRALVHRTEQASLAIESGAWEVLAGDLHDDAVLAHAAAGVRAVYHVCPNVSPDEVAIGSAVLAAARAAAAEHVVYHSVLHPQVEAMPHHWQKLRVEEMLFTSGLSWTILQPAAYMQNVLGQWDQARQQGIYRVPYGAKARLGMVDLEDVAAAAAVVLTEPGHLGAVYELAGGEALAPQEVAAALGAGMGRMVRAEQVPLAAWEAGARAAGMGAYQVDTLLRMFRYYDAHGFWGNPGVLSWLLGRPPATFAAFVERTLRERESQG